jgi:biopolymer transport protein ExbD
MAGAIASSGRAKTIAAINITPLVDVVLVLLVILMVASTYIVAQTLKVNLPKAKMSDGTAEKPNTVQLFKNGDLRWNEQPVTEQDLPSRIKEVVSADPEISLVISADKDSAHGQVVHIMDVAKVAGVTKFAINIMQAGGE